MSNIGDLVERLVSLGVSVGDASDVIAKAFAAGAASAPQRTARKPVQMTIESVPVPKTKGTRIPPDFKPDIDFALSLGIPRRKAELEADNFSDYWSGVPGKDGIKTNWPATWRNRCRAVAERIGAIPLAKPAVPSAPAVDPRKFTEAEWAPILSVYARTSNWNPSFGPEPGLPGSFAPTPRLL